MTARNPYWPLSPGSYVDYTIETFTGSWVDSNMALVVEHTAPHDSRRLTMLAAGDFVGIVGTAAGVPATALQPFGTIYEDAGPEGWGEAVNQNGWVQEPPILLLPNATNPGWRKDLVSHITAINPDGTRARSTFPYRTGIVSKGAYGTYPDTIRTALREMPDAPNSQVYNYVFARNIGWVSFWYGTLAPGGKVINGYVFSIQGHGP